VLGRRIEITALRKNGEEFPVEISITPVDMPGSATRFSGFLRDITERKQNEKKLKEAVRARDEFLSIASHEFKTPLTSLRLNAQIRLRSFSRAEVALPMERLRRIA